MRKRNIKVLLSVTGLFVLLAAFIGYGLYCSACTLTVTTYALSSEKLSHAVRMVQLTDLHNSVFGENNAELVETVAEQQPDVILITGDLLNGDEQNTDIAAQVISQLCPIAPVYVSYGNHEIQYENNYHADLAALYKQAGATMREYAYEDVTINGQAIRLGGIYGYCTPEEYLETKEADEAECTFLRQFQDTNRYTVLLTHMPFAWIHNDGISKWHIDCVFTGHTHGGQARIPFIGGLYAPDAGWFPGREKGLYYSDDQSKVMVLSSGLGSNERIPRFNNIPEIVVVDVLPE